jgi:threonine dehydratase
MRCVRAPSVSGPSFPDRSVLEAVRHLGRRFPGARLREVPLVRASDLDLRADPTGTTRVWLALEALQVTGCYQVRGALSAVADIADRKTTRRVVAPSVGNHGVAVAYAACMLGMSATVVVPRTTARNKREKIEQYGADLVVTDSDRYEAAEEVARELAASNGAAPVAPEAFETMLGNGGSLGLEIVRGLGGVPETLLVPYGSGCLATGIAWALAAEAASVASIPSAGVQASRGSAATATRLSSESERGRSVWGVQSEANCTLAGWLERGVPDRPTDDAIPPSSVPSLADEIQRSPGASAFARARNVAAGVVVAGEAAIAEAMAHAYRDMGLVLEGTAALALAPVLFGLPEAVRGGDLVVVLTGRNVDSEVLLRYA